MRIWFHKSRNAVWLLALSSWCWTKPAAGASMMENLFMVRVNGKDISESEPVLEWEPGRLFVSVSVLNKARIKRPPVKPTPVAALGIDYVPIDAIPGARYTVDTATQTLDITVPPFALLETRVDGINNPVLTPSPSPPGLFLNHDFELLQGNGQQTLSGLVEAGFFSRLGVLTTEFAGANLTNTIRPLRLTTQFFHDFPQSMTNLTIGDNVSAVSPWAKTVYYAGASYASKFATQPSFIPTVLPSLSGQAVQPSTVDVYVDNVKKLSQPVDAGPFSINNVPVLSDQGQIRMVVTDILGRQEVITESYIRSSQLLREGVDAFTYEAGSLRLNYGIASDQYHSVFGAITDGRGITNSLTLESRLEIQPTAETAGIGAVYAVRGVGLVAGGVAGSVATAYRMGGLYYGQFSRQTRAFGFSAQVQRASEDFRQLGLLNQQLATKMLLQAQVSRSLGRRVSFIAGYLRRDGRTETSARVLTSTLSFRLGRAYLNFGGTYSLLNARQNALNISLIRPLGERTIAMASGQVSPGLNTSSLEVDRSIPLGPGYGYRLRTSEFDQQSNDAGFYYQTSQGYYGIEAAEQNDQTTFRYIERGSLVFIHKQLMLSRWLNDAFGVVDIPGEKGVPVYVNHQLATTTDWRGIALVPWMVSYSRNTVNLDGKRLANPS